MLKYFVIAGLLLFLSACQKTADSEKNLNEKFGFSSTEYGKVFKSVFYSIDSSFIRQNSFSQHYDTLQNFYTANNYQPVFIKSFNDKKLVDSLLLFFSKAEEHGLNPEQYHFSAITREFYKAIDSIPSTLRYASLAKTEILVSDAILKYSKHYDME